MVAVGVVGIVLALVGVVVLVDPDIAWSFTQRRNEAMGVDSDRTARWDSANRISGVIGIVVGAGVVLFAIAD